MGVIQSAVVLSNVASDYAPAGKSLISVSVGDSDCDTDTAARLVRLGVATAIPRKRFTAKHALPLLRDLLDGFDYAGAAALGRRIGDEDGALLAAMHLAQIAAQG